MYQLSDTDGTPAHRRAIRHHISKCRAVKSPLHQQLVAEALAAYQDLKAKARATEDAEDDRAATEADVEWSELAFEDAIRDLDADLAKLDRTDPTLGARAGIFPDGFGAVIEPDDDAQLGVLPALHVRIKPFENRPELADSLAKLASTEATFQQKLEDNAAAVAAEDAAFAAEIAARAAIRAQLNSAHGRLRDFYKSRPKQAEQFFLRTGKRRAAKATNTQSTTPQPTAPDGNTKSTTPHPAPQGGATP
ncbi:MAG: hypothetical protein QM820_56340 [Minicystis sp.]